MDKSYENRLGYDVAVVGMAGRFPGAEDINQYWDNIVNGVESISFFTNEELKRNGVDPELLNNKNFIKAKGTIENAESFDASFFGYSQVEATMMDPQLRIFHETVWAALEHAGVTDEEQDNIIGLYGGASPHFIWEYDSFQWGLKEGFDTFTLAMRNNKDFLCTQIAHRLSLKGPSISLYSACSTSLVAIHQAIQALISGECDIAVAGGVSLDFPMKNGYIYQEGMIKSKDGHCKAFDRESSGTVYGNGTGAVVLKRLEDAIEQNDTIYAVVRGSAVNNDGSNKASYTAPSIQGQANVIKTAQIIAGISPESIQYIETHGTGTKLGDAIEYEGLKNAFSCDKRSFCVLGSVKPNIGHLDAASGVASFIKAVLVLYNAMIPPMINFKDVNPIMDIADSSFYFNDRAVEYKDERPMRAGVSSFGLGGTNCHIVLQQYKREKRYASEKRAQIISISGKTERALFEQIKNLSNYSIKNKTIDFNDFSYTLHTGRKQFEYRYAMVCEDFEEFNNQCRRIKYKNNFKSFHIREKHPIALVVMAQDFNDRYILNELLDKAAVFKNYVIECCNIISDIYNIDSLEPEMIVDDSMPVQFHRLIQFVIKYSLAKYYFAYGLKIDAVIGCNKEIILAGVLSGIISLRSALQIIFFDTLGNDISLFVYNIEAGIKVCECICGENGQSVSKEQFLNPESWISGENDKIDFSVFGAYDLLILDICKDVCVKENIYNLIPLIEDNMDGYKKLLIRISEIWMYGIDMNWSGIYEGESCKKIGLPLYPFEKKVFTLDIGQNERYALETNSQKQLDEKTDVLKKNNFETWFYQEKWEKCSLTEHSAKRSKATYLIFSDGYGIGIELTDRLRSAGNRVIIAMAGKYSFEKDNCYIDLSKECDYDSLFRTLSENGTLPDTIIHLGTYGLKDEKELLEKGYYSSIYIAKQISKSKMFHKIKYYFISDQMFSVNGQEDILPEKTMVLSVCNVLPQEQPNILCKTIDLPFDAEFYISDLVQIINNELSATDNANIIAYRDGVRKYRTYDNKIMLQDNKKMEIVENGVYVIIGGLGQVGMTLAKHITQMSKVTLVLIGRTKFPEKEKWNAYIADGDNDSIKKKMKILQEIEKSSSVIEVMQADVAYPHEMKSFFECVNQKYGRISGVIHAAGVVRCKSGQTAIESISRQECEEQLTPKMDGIKVLYNSLKSYDIDFCMIISSLASILGGLGHVAYSAANIYLDSFVDRLKNIGIDNWICVNWAEWKNLEGNDSKYNVGNDLKQLSLTREEGCKCFDEVLKMGMERLIISTGNLKKRLDQWILKEDVDDIFNDNKGNSNINANSKEEYENIISDLWMNFYGVESVDKLANFFELGATSLDFIHIISKLGSILKTHVPIECMFEYPTISELASHFANDATNKPAVLDYKPVNNAANRDIAIIGMAGRLPKAKNISEFWENLLAGKDCITFFTDEELIASGIEPEKFKDPQYVRAKGYISHADEFDAEFFKYTPIDATAMDPQIRVFHECVWETLEHAGYNPEQYDGRIGLFAGATPNLYWEVAAHLSSAEDSASQFGSALLYDKDALTNQISYKLDLKGPSITLFTGCSTSLVAVDEACQSLLSGKCDMAIAGGVTITLPVKAGYTYQEGMVASKNGQNRSFDEDASGVVFSDGAAAVLLKSMDVALADGDTIYGIIKGTFVNNDGTRKVGYTSPSISGQVEVIKSAMKIANVDPDDITYVEAHGTATKLGDPIEVRALSQAYDGSGKQHCYLGSVKSNLGHTMCAAGVAGIIKTVLAMENHVLPPSIHCENPNKLIRFEDTPFVVNNKLTEWKSNKPLLAGVSSLGIGGTNAHVILEEAPKQRSSTRKRHWKMLMLSARSEESLSKMTKRLEEHILKHEEINISDVAYTLQIGRKKFRNSKVIMCEEREDLLDSLRNGDKNCLVYKNSIIAEKIIFVFAGQNSYKKSLAYDLYMNEPYYRNIFNEVNRLAEKKINIDISKILYSGKDDARLGSYWSVALFAVEYSLTRLMIYWGVRPDEMIGYSFGEYIAACIAGVISMDEMLDLIIFREQLMRTVPEGAMLSIPLNEQITYDLMNNFYTENKDVDPIYISILNGESNVLGGYKKDIILFQEFLRQKRIISTIIDVPYAVHTPIMKTVSDEYRVFLSKLHFSKPELSYISGVTGDWMSNEKAVDAEYWISHICEPMRISEGLRKLTEHSKNCVFIEIGSGRELSILLNRYNTEGKHLLINMIQEEKNLSDDYYLLRQVSCLWSADVKIDWAAFYTDERRMRIELPSYPFEHKKYWTDTNPLDIVKNSDNAYEKRSEKIDIAGELYVPIWRRSYVPKRVDKVSYRGKILVFADSSNYSSGLTEGLKRENDIVVVIIGDIFTKISDKMFYLNPTDCEGYKELFNELKKMDFMPDRLLHMWSLNNDVKVMDRMISDEELGFFSILYIVQSYSDILSGCNMMDIFVVTMGIQSVNDEVLTEPVRSIILGICMTIPQEYKNMRCKVIDFQKENKEGILGKDMVRAILTELKLGMDLTLVAYRKGVRWEKTYDKLDRIDEKESTYYLRDSGVYLVLGGLGGIGLSIAQYLAREYKPVIVLVNRSAFPKKEMWDNLIAEGGDKEVINKIEIIRKMESYGATIEISSTDITSLTQMKELDNRIEGKYGHVNGIIQAAGIADGGLIQLRQYDDVKRVFNPKINGTLVLDEIYGDRELDFMILCSSMNAVTGGYGQMAYNSANIFLDSYAQSKRQTSKLNITSINWYAWENVGMFEKAISNLSASVNIRKENALSVDEGIKIFLNAITGIYPQIAVAPGGVRVLREEADQTQLLHVEYLQDINDEEMSDTDLRERPNLDSNYIQPRNSMETDVCEKMEYILGIRGIGVEDDFFSMGGDSLKAITMLSHIQRKYDVNISIADFFHMPTVDKLCRYISQADNKFTKQVAVVAEKRFYEVANVQKGLFAIQVMNPESTIYNEVEGYMICGYIDIKKLELCFHEVVKRHEALRSVFKVRNNELIQEIYSAEKIRFEHINARIENLEKTVQDFIRPFNLSSGPLFHVGIFEIKPEQILFVLNIHHIITDGISDQILMEELIGLYNGNNFGTIPYQYKDFTEWQKKQYAGKEYLKQEEYWLNVFKDGVPVLMENKAQIVKSDNVRVEKAYINVELTLKLKELAKKTNSTLYMVLVSVYSVLLHGYFDKADICIGTPVSGRNREEFQRVIGMFVNMIVLRTGKMENQPFHGLLMHMQQVIINALENQEYSYDDLVDKLREKRLLKGNKVFQAAFAMQNMKKFMGQLKGATIEEYEISFKKQRYDLLLRVYENKDELLLCFDYPICDYMQTEIRNLLEDFIKIVELITKDESIGINEVVLQIFNAKEEKMNSNNTNDSFDFIF